MIQLKKVRRSLFFQYSLLFVMMTLVIFSAFILSGRSLIWNLDGAGQHYPILKQFHAMVWDMLRSGHISGNWDFTVGLGADTYNTFSYYVLGDPFTYLSLLFPASQLELAYHLMIIFRLYLVGLAFLFYAKRFKVSHLALLSGSMSYLYCGYIATVAARHPMFITPMIVMPVIFIGIEKIRDKQSPILFIIAVALALVSNFYFAYVLALIAGLYWVIRFVTSQNKTEKFLGSTLQLIGYSLVSLLLAGVIFLPIIFTVLSASRLSSEFASGMMLYDPQHYTLLPKTLITTSGINQVFWTSGGYSTLVLIILPFIFRRRKEYPGITLSLILGGMMVLLPFFGAIFNALSSPSNRWTFALAFPIGLSVMFFFDQLKTFDKKDFNRALIVSIICLALINYKSYWDQLVLPISVLFLSMLILYVTFVNKKTYKWLGQSAVSLTLCGLMLLNICFVQSYYYLGDNGRYLHERVPYGKIDQQLTTAFDGVERRLPTNSTDRMAMSSDYPNESKKMNVGMLLDTMMMESYYTLQSATTYQLAQDLAVFGSRPSIPLAHGDERTGVYRALGVRYLLTDKQVATKIPYGFELNEGLSQGQTDVYESSLTKPFMSFSDQLMTLTDYESLSPLDKETALGTYTIVEELPEGFDATPFEKRSRQLVEYKKDQGLNFSTRDQVISLPIPSKELTKGSETFVRIRGLRFKPEGPLTGLKGLKRQVTVPDNRMSAQDIGAFQLKVSDGKTTSTIDGGLNASLSGDENTEDYLINLGYHEDQLPAIELSSSVPGEYTFDSMEILVQPYDQMSEAAFEAVTKNTLDSVEIKNSYVSGEVTSDKPGVIHTLIPYSTGWEVTIDGVKGQTLPINRGFIGTYVEAGKHEVTFTYHTPGLKTGAGLSILGLVLIGVIHRKQKRLGQ